jgi:FG-GAP-like repeat
VTATVTNNPATASLVLLDGKTGTEHFTFPGQFSNSFTPAIGAIDGDGLLEVVARDVDGYLVAFENDGTPKWKSETNDWATQGYPGTYCGAASLYDLDGDGKVEILAGFNVFDENGKLLWGKSYDDAWPGEFNCPTPIAADLDDDGKLEVIFGSEAFRADGTLFWSTPGPPGQPALADFDGDGKPEILLTNENGITLIDAVDGSVEFGPIRPTQPDPGARCWGKPVTVHDFDGDGRPEAAIGTCVDFSMYEIGTTATPIWTASIQDLSGLSTATAFDFLGDGSADAIYEDETQIYVYDGEIGKLEMAKDRPSGTLIEYPVVADVDNDGSADVLVVANNYPEGTKSPSLFMLSDAQGRWVPTRRIWNQHAYHVTNVREDGTIPKVMKKSWLTNNTFRANSQVGQLGDCVPVPK